MLACFIDGFVDGTDAVGTRDRERRTGREELMITRDFPRSRSKQRAVLGEGKLARREDRGVPGLG